MKQILSALLIFLSLAAFSQTGSIKGTVKTSDGYPAELVSIAIKGTKIGTLTNKAGRFEIKRVKPGHYTLLVSFAGQQASESIVQMTSDRAVTVPEIVLKENAEQLNAVVVLANRSKKQSEFVAKMPLNDLENSQVYSVVSSEILKQQAITNYDDALRNVPGISQTWQSTGRSGDGASYFALRGLEAQATLYNGLPGITSGNLDPADVERIEVLKGPSGTLFGSSVVGYGGLINTVTKKPYFNSGGEVSYSAGSFGLNRITADVNLPLSKTEKIAMRVNTAFHSENSFQDAGFKKSFFIAPAFTYEINDRLTLNFLAEVMDEERAVAPVFFHTNRAEPMQFKNIEELNLNPKLSFISNDLTIKNPRYNIQAEMRYKISSQWTSQTVLSRGNVKSSGYYSYIWPDVTGTNFFGQYFSNQQATASTSDIQQNFNADFKIGSLRNRLVLGFDVFSKNNIDNSSGYGLARSVSPQGEESFKDPYTGEENTPVYLTKSSVDNLLGRTGDGSNSNVTNNAYSVYASDVVNILPPLLAMASVRVDYFESKGEKSDPKDGFHQTAVSPKFGLVYQPILGKLALFANYMNGFRNVDPMQIADADGSNLRIKSFRAEQANQLEFGIKTNLSNNKLNTSVSYYDIKISNRVTGDPDNFYNYLQGGKMQSKGFEIDLDANPAKGLYLIAGFSHNNSKVLTGDENDFYSTPGRSAGGQGPNDQVNFWAAYKFTSGALKHFGLGLGGNYASEYKVVDSKITGDFNLPAYTVINAGIFYEADKIRANLNVNNANNKQYYIGYWSVNPQEPRNVVVSVAFKWK